MLSKKQGLAAYSEHIFGKAGYFIVTYCYGLFGLIGTVAVLITSVSYGSSCYGIQLSSLEICLITIALLWFCALGNFFGSRVTGTISSIAVWFIIAPILFLCVAGWFWFDADMYIGAWNPHDMPVFDAVSSSIAMTLWAFIGLETACANSDAIDDPQKNVPLAVMFAILSVAVIYIGSTNVIAGIVPNFELAASNAPFGLVFAYMFNEDVGTIVKGLLVVSCTGCGFGWQFTACKIFQFAAANRMYPAVFNQVNRHGAPMKGIIWIAIIQTVICCLTASPTTFDQFQLLSNLAVVAMLVPYIMSMVAIPMIMKRASTPIAEQRANIVMAMLATLYCFYAMYTIGESVVFCTVFVIFFSWVLWGFVAPKFDLEEPQ